MAADQEVIRSFLVSLGFDINIVEQRKFDETIIKAEKAALRFGKILVGTAAAAQTVFIGFAEQMAKLYYMSQRTGASVGDIQAASFAGKQVGLNAQTIQTAIESIARAMRSNPGVEAVISGITGQPAKGRSPARLLEDLVKNLSKMPDYVALQYAQQVGIDPDTYIMLKNNLDAYLKAEETQRQMMRDVGLDADKSAKSLTEYSKLVNQLADRFEVLGEAIGVKTLPYFREFAKEMDSGLVEFTKRITGPEPLGRIEHVKPGKGTTGNPKTDDLIRGTWLEYLLHGYRTPPGRHRVSGLVTVEGSSTPSAKPASLPNTRGAKNNNPGNIEYGSFARSMGATGSDGRFAIFPDMATGSRAMAALLASYSKQGINTISGIVGKWAPAKEPGNDVGSYSAYLGQYLGVGVNDKLDLNNQSTMARLISGIGLRESRVDPIAAAGKGITLESNTTIHISGAESPAATAKAVAAEQARVTADTVRQLKGAVQ